MARTETSATKERILLAGLRLFGDLGYTATSMRALTDAAKTNIASVNYHFDGKVGLFRAVTAFAMADVNTARARMLDVLESRGRPPEAVELTDAFIGIGLDVGRRSDGLGPAIARFVGRVVCDPAPEARQLFGAEVAPVEGRYLEALAQALPRLPAAVVEFRYRAMAGLLALHQSGTLAELVPGEHRPSGITDAAELHRAVRAIITAPAG